MALSLAFANYPKPVEAPETGYAPPPAKNPVLRGYPLVVASALYVCVPLLPGETDADLQ
jgi:hypothetical protein